MAIRLLVIVGPTACGKTRLGVDVAHRWGSEIASADSRQVYRGLDIGAGKDLDEYRRVSPAVPYHLIDLADPRSIYTVFHFQRDCYALLEGKAREKPFAEGTPLVMVGGSGLYVEAVLRGYRIPNVPEDPELRRELMRRDHEELARELRAIAPELARRTDFSSKKRIVRALEIERHSRRGTLRESGPPPVAIEHSVYGVELPREEIDRRIAHRLEQRLAQGLIAEVEGLLRSGVSPERMAMLGLEYREVTAYVTGEKTEAQMIEDLLRGIRRFARRQQAWFRGFPRRGIEIRWIGPEDRETILAHRWPSG